MLLTKPKIIQEHVAQSNKTVMETEKGRDELHNQIEQIEQRLHPKRVHTHDDGGDVYKMLGEVDNWDLRVHLREATHVTQNRRNVEVGSLENQPNPHTGKDGFLCHTRLGANPDPPSIFFF